MSTPIWITGDLLASIAAVRCDRCNKMGACLQLHTHGDEINVCIKRCFLELAHSVGWFAGDSIRQAMGAGLRREGTLPLDCPSPFADGEAITGERFTEADRELLNRTWCPTCLSHFCADPTRHRR